MKKQIILNYPILLFSIVNIFSFILLFYFFKNEFSNYIIFKTIIFIGFLWIPYLVGKIIGKSIPKFIYQLYFFFIVLDILFGEILMVDRLISFYSYLMLLIQGMISFIFGLWLIKYFDDYGILNSRIVNVFSLLFAISLSVCKELIFYLIRYLFSQERIDSMMNLIFTIIGTIVIYMFVYYDMRQLKGKYYKLLDNELNKRTN